MPDIAYIAGPISGVTDYRSQFAEAARVVREHGINTVLNPATLPQSIDSPSAMRICLSMIDTADVVYFMPDWRYSIGATLEHTYAEYIGKEIRYLPGGDADELEE